MQCSRVQCPSYAFGIYALEGGGLKEFFLAVAKTVLSATMKYAAPATTKQNMIVN